MRREHDVQLVYFVMPEEVGRYGNDVEYIALTRKVARRLLFPWWRRRYARQWGLDLVHYTHQQPRLLKRRVSPLTLVTFHDINFVHNNLPAWKVWKKGWLTRRRMSRATHLSFFSEFARRDVLSHFPSELPTRVIYNGVDPLVDVEEESMNLEPGFLLYIASLSPKKNVDKLIDMMAHLPERQLVVAGAGSSKEYGAFLRHKTEELRLKNVTFVGRVSLGEKAWLLRHCVALCFPSQSEGFGLPPIEAMQMGKGAFLSPFTSLPEIGGDYAYYFPSSLDAAEMAATIERHLPELTPDRCHAIASYSQRFNWPHATHSYLSLYLDILGEK